MIPELFDGVLPEGIHSCTIEEVEKVFGKFRHTDKRPRLIEKLKQYLADVRAANVASAVIIDGSFITAKAEPSDIDLILALRADLDLSEELKPMEYNVQSKRMVSRLYGFDVLPAVDASDSYNGFVEFFSRVRLDDPEQNTSQHRKGLLRIEL